MWALASQPAFNPNAMTLGTTLAGEPLAPAGQAQIFNKAVLAAYPAGSSFKPFTLAAALQDRRRHAVEHPDLPADVGVRRASRSATTSTTPLPGSVGLAEAMAFSCNTTYMPLSLEVYQAEETALTDLLSEFGFGAATGIGYLVEETGIVPDDAWLAAERPRRLLRLRADPAGHRPGRLPRHPAPAGQRLRRHRQRRHAVAAADRDSATLPDGTVVEQVDPTEVRQISVIAGAISPS